MAQSEKKPSPIIWNSMKMFSDNFKMSYKTGKKKYHKVKQDTFEKNATFLLFNLKIQNLLQITDTKTQSAENKYLGKL